MNVVPDRLLRWAADAVFPGAEVASVEQLRKDSGPWLVRIDDGSLALEVVLKVAPADELACEAAALRLAEEHVLPTPRLRAVDLTGELGAPVLVSTYMPGGTSEIPLVATRARLRALGAAAAALHQIPLSSSPDLPHRARHCCWTNFSAERRWARAYQAASDSERPSVLEEMLLELPEREPDTARERLLTASSTPLLERCDNRLRELPVPDGETVFVHGDLWQGNTLWDGDRCVGIFDWDSAGAGHYGVDLGSLRWDAAILFGLPASDEVLAGWEEAMGKQAECVPYWDLVAALNTPADMAAFGPVMHESGRADLDGPTMTHRRVPPSGSGQTRCRPGGGSR
jgi:aminoglycoside phosphotransferase (APT) family kinase protein